MDFEGAIYSVVAACLVIIRIPQKLIDKSEIYPPSRDIDQQFLLVRWRCVKIYRNDLRG